MPDPGLPGKNVKVRFEPEEAKLFGAVVKEALKDARTALAIEGIKASAEAWSAVFGPKFPTVPATITEKEARQAAEEDEGDEALDEEIVEVELPPLRRLGLLKIQAHLSTSENGVFRERYPSGGRALPKRMYLRFSILRTDVLQPYEVRWIVTNHGREARESGDIIHTVTGRPTQVEGTKYRGIHHMTCELRRSGVLLAQARHVVNIG